MNFEPAEMRPDAADSREYLDAKSFLYIVQLTESMIQRTETQNSSRQTLSIPSGIQPQSAETFRSTITSSFLAERRLIEERCPANENLSYSLSVISIGELIFAIRMLLRILSLPEI
jgi:hypothetical protein